MTAALLRLGAASELAGRSDEPASDRSIGIGKVARLLEALAV